ncbi:MAG: NrfD/PsrC family molybdoenzyme membrane anchor subunit [Gemmatimonadota bacterium]
MNRSEESPERLPEERLDALREEALRTGSVSGTGTRAAGGPMPALAADGEAPGYYGRPIVKPPVWTWEIPLYFFFGGLAGMAAAIALAAHVAGDGHGLVRAALWLAFATGAVLSPILLVMDLGRPSRFLNMLRVFKLRSPMSVGAWILFLFGGSVTMALALTEWTIRYDAGPTIQALQTAALVAAGFFGPALATYTGVLLGATAIPAWFAHHHGLPVHFGVAGLGSAAAALELLGFRVPALHLIGLVAAVVETLFGAWIELRRHGAIDRALRDGAPGLLLRGSGLLTGPASLALRLLGLVPWAGLAFLAGALISRYGWLAAGQASGRDPQATLEAQEIRQAAFS